MGAGVSGVRNGRFVWLDLEGGLRGTRVWDVATIEEPASGGPATATRFMSYANARQRRQLKRSLPAEQYARLQPGKAHVGRYAQGDGGAWALQELELAEHTSVEDCLREHLAPVAADADSVLAAWNMRCSDKHVLQRVLGDMECHLADPLPWFRRRIMLPTNSLATKKRGSPRHALEVEDADVGCCHTALVDTLHLRECTRRAVALAERAEAEDAAIRFEGVARLPAPPVHRIALQLLGDAAPAWAAPLARLPGSKKLECPEMWRAWVLAAHLFDDNDRLLAEHSKSHKRRVRAWLHKQHRQPPHALNACRRRDTLERLVENALLK